MKLISNCRIYFARNHFDLRQLKCRAEIHVKNKFRLRWNWTKNKLYTVLYVSSKHKHDAKNISPVHWINCLFHESKCHSIVYIFSVVTIDWNAQAIKLHKELNEWHIRNMWWPTLLLCDGIKIRMKRGKKKLMKFRTNELSIKRRVHNKLYTSKS